MYFSWMSVQVIPIVPMDHTLKGQALHHVVLANQLATGLCLQCPHFPLADICTKIRETLAFGQVHPPSVSLTNQPNLGCSP